MKPWQRETLGLLAALLVAIVATIGLTWPVAAYADEVVLGGGELGGWLWRSDWHFRSLLALDATDLGPLDRWRAVVGLGRYPETGNVLDILALSFPLERMFSFPFSYNAKIFVIFIGNGVCAYALGRYVSGSITAGLAAAALGVVNPVCIQEIHSSGLRQALLWWLLLYPALLDRALRERRVGAGVLAGACFGLASAFYWFYGLFTGMFTAMWVLGHALSRRRHLDLPSLGRTLVAVGVGVVLMAGPFVLPYAFPEEVGGGSTRATLPEMSFFLPFPSYDTVSHAPLRPSTYAENVLSSINRTIASSWGAAYPVDPTMNEGLPLVVLFLGVVPGFVLRRSRGWVAVWLFFYMGTLGPFLRISAGDTREVTRIFDDYVLRLPYTWMFQFVPGMSRMFAPYRLGSYMVVASVALVALTMARVPWRRWLWPLLVAAIVLQPLYRWGRGSVNEGDADSREMRSPFKFNRIHVPEPYRAIDVAVAAGIVELPLGQQQDLLCYYQTVHQQKVYRSWASPGAIPPAVQPADAGGALGARLRYQARTDVVSGEVPDAWEALSRDPVSAPLDGVTLAAVQEWASSANYRRIILHERGYYLVDRDQGSVLYRAAVDRLSAALGLTPSESVELSRVDPSMRKVGVSIAGDLAPWTSQPVDLAPDRAPDRYSMAVFVLPEPTNPPLDSAPKGVD